MKPSKKNSFLNFMFAFCPGAAEMYMGFMKNGVSLLAIFVVSFGILTIMGRGDIFFVIPFVVYVYGFFHARNLATAAYDDFILIEDKYIWEEFTNGKAISMSQNNVRKWTAIALIVFGICGMWFALSDSLNEILAQVLNDTEYQMFEEIFDTIPQIVVAILAIVFGIKLIKGKKEEILKNDSAIDLTAKIIANTEKEISKIDSQENVNIVEAEEGETDGTESDK